MAFSVSGRLGILACVTAVVLTVSGPSAQKPDAGPVLAAAAEYLAKYEREVVAVVAQEDYRQTVADATVATRRLRSDMVMIANAERGWLELRDVFEVDGRPVRDHTDRIMQLFTKPNPHAGQQAARIVEEGARFNLAPSRVEFERTLNVPLEALRFLRKVNQSRSRFEIAGEERSDAGQLVVVRFTEESTPRVIQSPLGAPASGRFWIEPASGAVVRSELKMSAPNVTATIKVTYARQLEPSLWLPATMTEEYDLLGRTVALSGMATYSNFRRFRVDVSSDLKSE